MDFLQATGFHDKPLLRFELNGIYNYQACNWPIIVTEVNTRRVNNLDLLFETINSLKISTLILYDIMYNAHLFNNVFIKNICNSTIKYIVFDESYVWMRLSFELFKIPTLCGIILDLRGSPVYVYVNFKNIADILQTNYKITFTLTLTCHYYEQELDTFAAINTRNLDGYKKVQNAVILILLADVFKHLGRDVVGIIARLVWNSRYTKIWC